MLRITSLLWGIFLAGVAVGAIGLIVVMGRGDALFKTRAPTVNSALGNEDPTEPSPRISKEPAPEVTQDVAQAETCSHTRVYDTIRELPYTLPLGWSWEIDCSYPDEAVGLTDSRDKTVTLWPRNQSDEQLRSTAIHESAHVFDVEYMTRSDKQLWMYARGLEGPWIQGNTGPEEDFAESFAHCTGAETWMFETHLDTDPPNRAECALAISLVREARGVGVDLLD